MLIFNLLYIAIILVFIIDYSGFIPTIEEAFSKRILHSKFKFHIPKPFSCSLCSTFWAGLIYILCISEFNLFNLVLVCLVAASTIVLSELLEFARDFLVKIIYLIRELMKI